VTPGLHARTAVAVIVARNEATSIGRTIVAAGSIEHVESVVVVDGHSGDGTAEEAESCGARVIPVPARGGKGGALEAAFDLLPPASAYLLVDGDVGETASAAGVLLEPVLSGQLDLCVGCLPPQGVAGFGTVKRLAAALIARTGPFRPGEPLSGQRAATPGALEACRPFARGFGLETAMTMDAVRLGLRVGERPVDVRHRPTGRDVAGFLHRGRQGADVLRAALPRLAGLR
jgi:glucosyl-3-phosphoglycerate synthase